MTDEINNVTGIKSKPKKITGVGAKAGTGAEKVVSAGKQTKGQKPNYEQRCEFLCEWLSGGDNKAPYFPSNLPKAPLDIVAHETERGIRLLEINRSNNTAKELSARNVKKQVMDLVNGLFIKSIGHQAKYCLGNRQAKDIEDRLRDYWPRLDKWPFPIGFKDTPGLCLARHDFNIHEPATPADFPNISKQLARMSNPIAFQKKYGAMFMPNSDRKQSVYLYGGSGGGKSTLGLMVEFGLTARAVCQLDDRFSKGDFDKARLVDKLLAVYDEAKPQVAFGNWWKQLTGKGEHFINPKGLPGFDAELRCHFLFSSNKPPQIPDDASYKNRLIICHVEPIPKEECLPLWEIEKIFKAEFPAWVRYCYKLADGKKITPDDSEQEDSEMKHAVEALTGPLEAAFDSAFIYDPKLTNGALRVTGSDLADAWQAAKHRNYEMYKTFSLNDFRAYVQERIGTRHLTKVVKLNGKSCRFVPFLKRKLGGGSF